MPKMIIGDDQYELTDSQVEFFKSLCRMIEGFNLYLESFVGTKNEESVVPKIGLSIPGVPYTEIPKMEKVPDPIEIPKCPEQLPLNSTPENESGKLVLGKEGKSYIFNHDAIAKLVGDGIGNKQIAEMAGVNVITMTKYLNESGLRISKSSEKKK